MSAPGLLHDAYAGFLVSTVELHKRLMACIEQVQDADTSTMYLNMLYSFLCALNQMQLLEQVEGKFGAKLHALPPAGLREAAHFLFGVVGPPPDLGLEGPSPAAGAAD